MNTLIFCKKTRFQKLYFWTHNYVSMSNLIDSKNKVTILREDIQDSSEYRLIEYESSQVEDKLLHRLLNKKILNKLQSIYTKDQCKNIFGKKLVIEANKILVSFKYAEAVAKKENIKNDVYIWPKDFDYSVYKVLNRLCILPNNIKITKISIIVNFFKSYLKNVYFFCKSFSILEKNIFTKKHHDSKVHQYKYIFHMDEGLKGWDLISNKYLIDNKAIIKDEVLFINSEYYESNWVDEYKKKNFNVLNIFELYQMTNRKVFYETYKKYFKLRLMIIYMLFDKSWLINQLFYILKDNFDWELFYKVYNIQKSISFMTARNITESLVHKRKKTMTFFIYFSVTENILKYINNPVVSQCHEYTHMYYDYLITNKISAKWIQTLQTEIDSTVILGPIFSEKIIHARNDKEQLINKLNLKNYEHIITYVDTPAGLYAESSISIYKDFMRSLIILSKNNMNICYLLKTKKPLNSILKLNDNELNILMKEVLNAENIIYINDLDISVYQAIGMSDLTISGRKSSLVYEALHARQPVICYDTLKPVTKRYLYHGIDKCNAYNHETLIELHDYWVNNYNMNDLDTYFSKIDSILEIESKSPCNIQALRDCLVS